MYYMDGFLAHDLWKIFMILRSVQALESIL